ncbi:MAG: hypothetical protein U0T83_02485 [Bacteriovoracaceae bacterium]
MSNLGVVPLFLLAAFLLAPLFCFLRALTVSVILVFDTILNLHLNYFKEKKSSQLLLIMITFVKVFVYLPTLIAAQEVDNATSIILKLGEAKPYPILNLKKYTLSNRSILTVKSVDERTLLFKAMSKGESSLYLYYENGLKKITIKVLSANLYNVIHELKQRLISKNIRFDTGQDTLHLIGTITDTNDYFLIQQTQMKSPFLNKNQLTLDTYSKNKLISEIYYYFFNQNIDAIKCTEKNLQFTCHYSLNDASINLNETITLLKKNYDINFIKAPLANINENYILKIKIIQIEKLNGEELDFGLDHFGGSFNDLFNIGVKGILLKHQFYFQEQNSDLSTLAEPEINIKLNKSATIEVGSEISFKDHLANNNDTITTHWKFAGLKLQVKLLPKGENFEVDYQTSFSRSENSSISTNKEHSAVQINLNNPIKLFEIGLRTTANQSTSMPLLNKIPILKNIFSSKSTQDNFKKITGIIKLERGVIP